MSLRNFSVSGSIWGAGFPRSLEEHRNQDKLFVHNLGYRNDLDNIKWSLLKVWHYKKLNVHNAFFFFSPTIRFKFMSNATIYFTPKMSISIINTEGCFFFSFIAHYCLQLSQYDRIVIPLFQWIRIGNPFWMPRERKCLLSLIKT